jgi:transcriptional regulator with XRE-family HTH domain
MNFELLKAIRLKGMTQREFAALVGDHESVVSRIIAGIWLPDHERMERYAKVLGKGVEEIFAENMLGKRGL